MKKILVVDVGGSNVKLMISADEKRRKFRSGPKLAPEETIAQIKEVAADWDYDAVALGFPSAVRDGKILKEPKNLGKGWVDYDFGKALGKPVRVINDAALQALGSYDGGARTLFLGLGTGLGSAVAWEGHVFSLELGFLPYINDGILEDQLGEAGMEKIGKKDWRREVTRAITQLKIAFIADQVVLGGGNAKLIEDLPEGVILGHNRNAYPGGVRLWDMQADGKTSKWQIL